MASSRPVAAGDHVFLVDGSSFIFRAYFQSRNQDSKYNSRTSDGTTSVVAEYLEVTAIRK